MNEIATFPTAIINMTKDASAVTDIGFSYTFQFWFFLPFHLLSIPCYLFILTYILLKKSQRQALHNHPILVYLIICFSVVIFDYSWTLNSAQHDGQVWLSSEILCQIWWFIDYGFYNACTVILAWTSFERHILIFHSDLVRTKRKRLLIHYLPLIVILIYLFIYYLIVIFFPPCENEYDYTLPVCGAQPCYLTVSYLAEWDVTIHGLIPTFLVVFWNITLLIRVFWQKRHRHQDWKKCRRMALQLLSISILFLSINSPLMLIEFVQIVSASDWADQVGGYLFFFCSLIQYLSPFICLISLPKVWKKLKLFFKRNRTQVMPAPTFGLTQHRS